jgi:hypothetical protein
MELEEKRELILLKEIETIVSTLEEEPELNSSWNLLAIRLLLSDLGRVNNSRLSGVGDTSSALINLRLRVSRLGLTAK